MDINLYNKIKFYQTSKDCNKLQGYIHHWLNVTISAADASNMHVKTFLILPRVKKTKQRKDIHNIYNGILIKLYIK